MVTFELLSPSLPQDPVDVTSEPTVPDVTQPTQPVVTSPVQPVTIHYISFSDQAYTVKENAGSVDIIVNFIFIILM